jgi:hypothetical protein
MCGNKKAGLFSSGYIELNITSSSFPNSSLYNKYQCLLKQQTYQTGPKNIDLRKEIIMYSNMTSKASK